MLNKCEWQAIGTTEQFQLNREKNILHPMNPIHRMFNREKVLPMNFKTSTISQSKVSKVI